MTTIEESLRAGVPVLVVDVKGDLPNLLLSFPTFAADALLPWIDTCVRPGDARTPQQVAAELSAEREHGLTSWSLSERELAAYVASTRVRVITPGSSAGELLHVLSSLERRSERWDTDRESARAALSAAVSLVLRLLGRDPDPAKSREHVLLSVLAERRLLAGEAADLRVLLGDLAKPPITHIGALEIDASCQRAIAARSPQPSTRCLRRPPSRAGAKAQHSMSAPGSSRATVARPRSS